VVGLPPTAEWAEFIPAALRVVFTLVDTLAGLRLSSAATRAVALHRDAYLDKLKAKRNAAEAEERRKAATKKAEEEEEARLAKMTPAERRKYEDAQRKKEARAAAKQQIKFVRT